MPALPNVVVVGAMKCATTALHEYLDAHPDVTMWPGKEANFFTGPDLPPEPDPARWWRHGQWHRGVAWYASLFDAGSPVRGESPPGYTSPDHPDTAQRMAGVVPDARLLYLVRDPVDRALSQYAHHAREGDERRPVAEALLDPESQYVARSRYLARLEPFLEHFAREQVQVVVQERLRGHRRAQLRRVYAHVWAAPDWWDDALLRLWHVGTGPPPAPAGLAAALRERVGDDVDRLRRFLDDPLEEW